MEIPTPGERHRTSCSSGSFRGVQRLPKQARPSLLLLVAGGKTLLLKRSRTHLDTEEREIRLGLSWKPPPCWVAFTVLEVAMQAMGAEESLIVSLLNAASIILTSLTRCTHCDNSGVIMMGIAGYFLIGFEANQKEAMADTVDLVQNLWLGASEVLKGELITVALLSEHTVKLPSKHSCLYPQVGSTFSLAQRCHL